MPSLMDPSQVGASIGNAFQQGMDQRRGMETQRALAAYAQQQTPENAMAVAAHNPAMGIQLQDREAARQKAAAEEAAKAEEAALIQAAVAGDPQARKALASRNFQVWSTLDKREQEELDDAYGFMSDVAQRIKTDPNLQSPELQAQAFDAAVDFAARRWPEAAQFKGQYSPVLLDHFINTGGDWKQFKEMTAPKNMNVAADETIVSYDPVAGTYTPQIIPNPGDRQPFSPASGQAAKEGERKVTVVNYDTFRERINVLGLGSAQAWLQANPDVLVSVTTPQQADMLPSGTRIMLPDGTEGVVP